MLRARVVAGALGLGLVGALAFRFIFACVDILNTYKSNLAGRKIERTIVIQPQGLGSGRTLQALK